MPNLWNDNGFGQPCSRANQRLVEVQPLIGIDGINGWAGFCLVHSVVSEKPVNRIQIVGSTVGTMGGWYVCHRADNLADSCCTVAAIGRVLS